MRRITLFRSRDCPLCEQLIAYFNKRSIVIDETIYMDTSTGLAEARTRDIFTLSVPVVQIGNVVIMTISMFKDGELDESGLDVVMGGE